MQRNINAKFRPRWRNVQSKSSKCGIASCDSATSKVTQMATKEEIQHILDQKVVSFTIDEAEIHVPLCQAHYNWAYTHLNTASACESCGGKPRRGERSNRHCPRPETINAFLTTVSNDSINLTKEIIICTACYKHVKIIVQNIQDGKMCTPSVVCHKHREAMKLIPS